MPCTGPLLLELGSLLAQVLAHLVVEWEGVSVGLAGLEAPKVKQQKAELVAAQDVLVIEGDLQDILGRGQAGGGSLRQGRKAGPPEEPSSSADRLHAGPHLHSTMDLVVEGLVPLRVTAVGYHPCLGRIRGCRGQP